MSEFADKYLNLSSSLSEDCKTITVTNDPSEFFEINIETSHLKVRDFRNDEIIFETHPEEHEFSIDIVEGQDVESFRDTIYVITYELDDDTSQGPATATSLLFFYCNTLCRVQNVITSLPYLLKGTSRYELVNSSVIQSYMALQAAVYAFDLSDYTESIKQLDYSKDLAKNIDVDNIKEGDCGCND